MHKTETTVTEFEYDEDGRIKKEIKTFTVRDTSGIFTDGQWQGGSASRWNPAYTYPYYISAASVPSVLKNVSGI